MVLTKVKSPLVLKEVETPRPGPFQVLIKVATCGICRTDLHVVDGELENANLPLIPGHQIIGRIIECGDKVETSMVGEIVGVPWLGGSCGHCEYCLNQQENLCDKACYTGYQFNGGFAEYCLADFRYIFPIPPGYSPLQAAPLLCAGLIGFRSYQKVGNGVNLGFYGFGAAAHILTQVACYENKKVFAFTKKNDNKSQDFARTLGAYWAGDIEQSPPELLDAAIIFAPVGSLIPAALKRLKKGGRIICAGIHMSDIPAFEYKYLWGERRIESVANLTRRDGELFLTLAPKIPIKTVVNQYSLEDTNKALDDLRLGNFEGAAVIVVDAS